MRLTMLGAGAQIAAINEPLWPQLPARDDVVEVTTMLDEHGPHPLAQGRFPDEAETLLRTVKRYERRTVEAAVTNSYDAALEALLAHPLVRSYPLARSILDDYVSAHAEFLTLA